MLTVDIGRNGKLLGDIVQGVRFKGLFPGSRLRNELITRLCIGKNFKNERMDFSCDTGSLQSSGNEICYQIINGKCVKDEGGHLVLENKFFHF